MEIARGDCDWDGNLELISEAIRSDDCAEVQLSLMMRFAPRDARWRQMALPLPPDPPVIIATRSWSGKG